jgi:hypothetical protein
LLEERQIEDTRGFSCSSLAQTPESHSGRQTSTQQPSRPTKPAALPGFPCQVATMLPAAIMLAGPGRGEGPTGVGGSKKKYAFPSSKAFFTIDRAGYHLDTKIEVLS